MNIILYFLFGHWFVSLFFHTFFLHRYATHHVMSMNRFWERVFYFLTWLTMGSSFLVPRAYAVMHRKHHEFSDTEKDPHSPHFFKDIFQMMMTTGKIYGNLCKDPIFYKSEFPDLYENKIPVWESLDRLGNNYTMRVIWGTLYTFLYIHCVFMLGANPLVFLLLPIHYFMGPIHGAIVNWYGHSDKYGYRNYQIHDHSKNMNPIVGLAMMGETYQNNHHMFEENPNFGKKKWEIDPTYWILLGMHYCGMIKLNKPKTVK